MKIRFAASMLVLLLVLLLVHSAVADGLPDQLAGDGLTVRFTNKTATASGTISLGANTYPFAGTFRDNRLVGRFSAGANEYDFTLTQNGAQFVLETGGTHYNLAAGNAQPAAGPVQGFTYESKKLVDPKSSLEVADILIPRGWKLEPGVVWRPMDAQFVSLNTAVYDPQTGWAARWIVTDQFSCDPTLFNNARQQGAKPVSGGMELTDTVFNAQQYVQNVVLPRYRKIEGLRVITSEDMPKFAQSVDQSKAAMHQEFNRNGREIQYAATRVRIEYPTPNGAVMEEDIYCVMQCSWDVQGIANARQVGLPGQYWFAPERVYGLTAPKGQLDTATPYLQTIITSLRPTMQWNAFVQNIQREIGHIQFDAHTMEILARKEITESQRKSVEDSWKSADQQSRDVGALISGTQARTNPNNPGGPPIAGPAGKNTWTNPQGEVKHLPPSENPNLEPGSSGNWTMAKNTGN